MPWVHYGVGSVNQSLSVGCIARIVLFWFFAHKFHISREEEPWWKPSSLDLFLVIFCNCCRNVGSWVFFGEKGYETLRGYAAQVFKEETIRSKTKKPRSKTNLSWKAWFMKEGIFSCFGQYFSLSKKMMKPIDFDDFEATKMFITKSRVDLW